MTTKLKTTEIIEILNENYYTLGVSGAQAVASVWGEIAEGYYGDQCDEWGITTRELVSAVNAWALWLVSTKRLAKPALL